MEYWKHAYISSLCFVLYHLTLAVAVFILSQKAIIPKHILMQLNFKGWGDVLLWLIEAFD